MAEYESEIQELIYGTLVGDTVLSAYLGADETDCRIILSLNNSEIKRISVAKPAYIAIETMPIPAPVFLGNGIEERTQRYCLHIFSKPENRELRAIIEERLRSLFHRKTLQTPRFLIYYAFEDGKDGTITGTGLFDYRYTIVFQFLLKGA